MHTSLFGGGPLVTCFSFTCLRKSLDFDLRFFYTKIIIIFYLLDLLRYFTITEILNKSVTVSARYFLKYFKWVAFKPDPGADSQHTRTVLKMYLSPWQQLLAFHLHSQIHRMLR